MKDIDIPLRPAALQAVMAERNAEYPDYLQVLQEANRSEDSFTEVEERHYPTNHTLVGYYVARFWRIPMRICNAILNHHFIEMSALENKEESNLIALIHLAEHTGHEYRRLTRRIRRM
ncbi:MAG: HDOD domain-containing protein [Gammaproteobacteria bacterium]|nr:HDOD domain-containing protein [Gammaproteobacteria bacterium]